MDAGLLVGRVVLIVIFLFSGVGKFIDIPGTAAQIAGKGLPMPELLALAAATAEVGGGLMILFGWKTKIAGLGLALYTVIATILFHNFWAMPPGAGHTNLMIHAMKNLSMIGGLITLAFAGAGRFSLDAQARSSEWSAQAYLPRSR